MYNDSDTVAKIKNRCQGEIVMNRTEFQNEHIKIEVTAHEDEKGKLLMVRATAAERLTDEPEPPLNLSIVIDRSGSMSGSKLKVAKQASARLVESLRPIDRVAVVAFANEVHTVSPPVKPSKSLARLIDSINVNGYTNLYGGWLTGAKLLEKGGRVLLLSDGQANQGRFTDAQSLSEQAAISYNRFGVATSTIGIGEDYDEGLMAGMARAGCGFHYFANTSESIMDAFSRERFLMRSLAIAEAKIVFGNVTVSIGQLLEGESKVVVAQIDSLSPVATFTYLDCKTEDRISKEINLPSVFGVEPIARSYELVELAAQLMDRSMDVRSNEGAQVLHDATRELLLQVLNNPLVDEEPLKSLVSELERKIESLSRLQRCYDEGEASFYRKRSASMGFNIRERGKAHTSVQDGQEFVASLRSMAYTDSGHRTCDLSALSLRPLEFWLNWPAAPLQFDGHTIRVGLVDPFDGFAVEALGKELGLKVIPDKRPWGLDEIAVALAM